MDWRYPPPVSWNSHTPVFCRVCHKVFPHVRGCLDHSAMKHGDPIQGPPAPYRSEDSIPVEDWHAMGVALMALGQRAKAGDALNITHEAAALGILPARLLRSLTAQGAPVPESTAP